MNFFSQENCSNICYFSDQRWVKGYNYWLHWRH